MRWALGVLVGLCVGGMGVLGTGAAPTEGVAAALSRLLLAPPHPDTSATSRRNKHKQGREKTAARG